MSTALGEAMHDLVTNVAPHIGTDDLPGRARVAGRRRRVRRRLGIAALLLGLTAAMVPAAGGLLGSLLDQRAMSVRDGDGAARDRATAHPVRIGHQWFVGTLPDRPGPIAGLVQMVQHRGTADEPLGWFAVAEDGHRWRLPVQANGADVFPTISFDGRWLGYLVSDDGPYVIHDLVTGAKTTFAQIGSSITRARTPYVVDGESPGFWAYDGEHLALPGGPRGLADPRLTLILAPDGTFVPLTNEVGALAGWVGDNAVLRLPAVSDELIGTTEPLVAEVTSIDGTDKRTVSLWPGSQWHGRLADQWAATLSPTDLEVVVAEVLPGSGAALSLRRFSLVTGRETSGPTIVPESYRPCQVGWAGPIVTVPILFSGDPGNTAYVLPGGLETVTVVEPGLGTRCFIWASSAVEGRGIGGGAFGRSTAWWTWWWREILATLAGLGAAILGWRWLVRRLRRRRWTRRLTVSLADGPT